MTERPRLNIVIRDYLLAAGWTTVESGGWLPTGHPKPRGTKRRARRSNKSVSYSTMAAVQRQMEIEFGEEFRQRREEYGLDGPAT